MEKDRPGAVFFVESKINHSSDDKGSGDHHLMRDGDALVPDAYRDDMALVLQASDYLVLLCGCCHAGLLNTLAQVKCLWQRPIGIVTGGLHLTSACDDDLRHIGDMLLAMPALQRIYPNHCTGEAAFVALTQILGPSVVHPCPAGTTLEF